MPLISEPAATAKGREDGQWIHVIGWRTPPPPHPDVRFLFGNVCTNFGLLSVVVPPPPDAQLYAPTYDSCPMFPPGKNRSSFVKFTFQCQKNVLFANLLCSKRTGDGWHGTVYQGSRERKRGKGCGEQGEEEEEVVGGGENVGNIASSLFPPRPSQASFRPRGGREEKTF